MKITNLHIRNFGIYGNTDAFNLDNKNLNIIIGKNGSGKTTFLNSIKTAFYGSMLFGTKNINETYNDFLLNMLNKDALKIAESDYFIELEFVSNIIGIDGSYKIKRQWTIQDERISESLYVFREDTRLTETERDAFLTSLYRTYPVDLFELFFLDGEKIDTLSLLDTDVVKLIETSINLDLFKNLKSDLEKYAVKESNKRELIEHESLKDHKIKEIKEINISIQEKDEVLIEFKKELYDTKLVFKSIDINIEKNKDLGHEKKITKIKSDLNELIKQKKEYQISFIPYLNLHDKLLGLQQKIRSEQDQKENNLVSEALSKFDINKFDDKSEYDSKVINDVIATLVNEFHTGEVSLHKLSNREFDLVDKKVSELTTFKFDDYQDILNKIKKKQFKVSKLEKEYNSTQNDDYKQKIDTLLNTKSKLTELELKIEILENERNQLVLEYNDLKTEIKELEKSIWKLIKSENSINVVSKLNSSLTKYIEVIRKSKVSKIEELTLFMFKKLIRKENFITNIIITENGMELYDSHQNSLKHSNLSAGERQLLVLSTLYAIVNTSARVIPLVFDSLLGRLDENHRVNVFNEFIHELKDQVIILATDSEINLETDSKKMNITNDNTYIREIDFSQHKSR